MSETCRVHLIKYQRLWQIICDLHLSRKVDITYMGGLFSKTGLVRS
jgi:hypothetical protein